MPTKIVPRAFYNLSPELVAPALLGKLLVRTFKRERLVGRITEIEAYLGEADPASHTFIGQTNRNSVLFGPPGYAYVYFVYGMYYCLNASCLPAGQPGGILFRALEPIEGIPTMARLRGLPATAKPKLLTSGPGRLCQALDITRAEHNGLDLASATSPLHILDDGFTPAGIETTPRVGIRKAQDRLLRFVTR
jgi:DNA-3-methyladenine glycosylase